MPEGTDQAGRSCLCPLLHEWEAVGIHMPSTKEQGVVLGKVCMPVREAGSVEEAIRMVAMVGAARTPGEEDTAAEGMYACEPLLAT